ncbi:MAG: VacB/RNase II family 3'-5' exoribonuclease, partial [Bacteroidetes bacterium]|nr:VacB/RNase II family 3'-5' exoribonuclease [Bacteroidota bacterium]
VDMKQTGKAYLISDEMKEDVFIAPNNTHHALDGDIVKVFLLPLRKGRKLEGEVVDIIERKKSQFVGIVEIHPTYAFLIPDNPSMTIDIFIPKDKLNGARHKEKAVCQITEWPDHAANPFGEITQVLGKPGVNDVEMKSILAEFEFPLAFPEKVEKIAAQIPMDIPTEEYKKRKDFRNIWTITIDPADAKDFDDAISFRHLPDGTYEVGVHIADVSYYVKPGTPLDHEAYKRGTSIYLVDRVVPMLPEKLSNELCSLKENEEKLCFAAVFIMNDEADILEQWIGRTVIRSVKRFSYDEVQEIIEQKAGLHSKEIGILDALAKKLREKRFKGGSFNFESQEVKFKLDEQGRPLGVYIREIRDSNRLIEDFMLLANRTVAERIGKKKGRSAAKTFVYRVHDAPNEEKLELFATFVSKLGYKINIHNRKMLASSFNKLFDQVKGKGEQNLVETVAVRTMAKAFYSTKNIGHYGLGFSFYTHFTSPIRRYPDLMVHRLLDAYLADGMS